MTLKERLKHHYLENEMDFDPEETKNVLEVLDECRDDLSNAGSHILTLLGRMVNDDELAEEIRSLEDEIRYKQFEDPFE